MKNAVKYMYDFNPIYAHFKKHYCPKCGERLKLKYISNVVNSNSAEAKNYDFSFGDTFLVGNVEFRARYFYCPKCGLSISFKEMEKHEKGQHK